MPGTAPTPMHRREAFLVGEGKMPTPSASAAQHLGYQRLCVLASPKEEPFPRFHSEVTGCLSLPLLLAE